MLILEHRFPGQPHHVLAKVDVNLVLESLGADQTRIGEWVNVIGYIANTASLADEQGLKSADSAVYAQAILVWSAGPFDLRRYEASLKALT